MGDADTLKKKTWRKGIRASDYENLDCLPAQEGFRHLDVNINDQNKSRQWLDERLKDYKKEYDLIFLDCPPTFSVLCENVLNISDRVVVPVVPTTLCERTYHQLLDFLKENKISRKNVRSFFSMVQKSKVSSQRL